MGDMIEDDEGLKLELKTFANVVFRNILSEAPYVEKQFYLPNHYNETIELMVDLQIPSDIYYQNIQLLIKYLPRGVQKIDIRPIIKLLHQVFLRQYNPIRNPLTLEGIMWVIRECMVSVFQRNDGKLINQCVDLNFTAALTKLVYKDSLFFNYALDILALLAVHDKVLDLFKRMKFHQTLLDLLLTKLNISDQSLLNCFTIILYTLENGFSVDDLPTLQSLIEAFHLQVDDRNSRLGVIQDCWLLLGQAKQSKSISKIIEVELAHLHLKAVEPTREDGSNRLHSELTKDPRFRKDNSGTSSYSGIVRSTAPDCRTLNASLEKLFQESKQFQDREDLPASAPSMPPKQVFIKLVDVPREKPLSKMKIIEVELDDEDEAIQDLTDEESALVYLRALYVNSLVEDLVGDRMKKAGIEDDGRLVETEEESRRREERAREEPNYPKDSIVHYIHQKKPTESTSPPGSRKHTEQQLGYDSALINLDIVNKREDESMSYKGSKRGQSPSHDNRNVGSAKERKGIGHTHVDYGNDSFSQHERPSKVNVYISSMQ